MLLKAYAAVHTAVRHRLEKADEITSSEWFSNVGKHGCSAVPAHETVSSTLGPGLLGQISNKPRTTVRFISKSI
jgi:hypothetical protein